MTIIENYSNYNKKVYNFIFCSRTIEFPTVKYSNFNIPNYQIFFYFSNLPIYNLPPRFLVVTSLFSNLASPENKSHCCKQYLEDAEKARNLVKTLEVELQVIDEEIGSCIDVEKCRMLFAEYKRKSSEKILAEYQLSKYNEHIKNSENYGAKMKPSPSPSAAPAERKTSANSPPRKHIQTTLDNKNITQSNMIYNTVDTSSPPSSAAPAKRKTSANSTPSKRIRTTFDNQNTSQSDTVQTRMIYDKSKPIILSSIPNTGWAKILHEEQIGFIDMKHAVMKLPSEVEAERFAQKNIIPKSVSNHYSKTDMTTENQTKLKQVANDENTSEKNEQEVVDTNNQIELKQVVNDENTSEKNEQEVADTNNQTELKQVANDENISEKNEPKNVFDYRSLSSSEKARISDRAKSSDRARSSGNSNDESSSDEDASKNTDTNEQNELSNDNEDHNLEHYRNQLDPNFMSNRANMYSKILDDLI